MIKKADDNTNAISIEVIDDPAVAAEIARRKELFERNWAWLEANATEVYSHRGKFICIAGQELFVGDSVEEVLHAAHPNDDGRFTRYIPSQRGPRVYASLPRSV